jgi:acyl-CoA thioesterase-1
VGVLVLELGANDGLRGMDPGQLHANLDSIIRITRRLHPDADIVIAGMEAPPNLGEGYTRAFRAVFRDLADRYDAALVPFLLEGVAAVDSLNQPDGIHPTAAGQRRVAANVWRVLEEVLRERAEAGSGR